MKTNTKARPARDRPAAKTQRGTTLSQQSMVWLTDQAGFDSLKCQGYVSLADNPEVSTAVGTIATLIGAMTIHRMRHTTFQTERGSVNADVRVIDELSRLVDIEPNRYMNRSNLVQWIIRTLFLEGRGNCVLWPRTERGQLAELVPIPAAFTSFVPDGLWGYRVAINGREYDPRDLLHFALNPGPYYPWLGTGYHVVLSDVANSLKQAAATSKSFMSDKWKPSLVVKVDAFNEEMSTKEGRRKILDDYVDAGEAGAPWIIPADQIDVKEVRPLTLSDLALADFVKLDKSTVASILGVPGFVLGVGEFKREAWNSFISAKIMPLAQILEQELTRKLSPDKDSFFRFNSRSLLSYSMDELVKAGFEMVDRMAMRRNEWRDWMGLDPDPDMDELLALENYIPADRLGDQKKLTGGNST